MIGLMEIQNDILFILSTKIFSLIELSIYTRQKTSSKLKFLNKSRNRSDYSYSSSKLGPNLNGGKGKWRSASVIVRRCQESVNSALISNCTFSEVYLGVAGLGPIPTRLVDLYKSACCR